jgi:hypothetical protein
MLLRGLRQKHFVLVIALTRTRPPSTYADGFCLPDTSPIKGGECSDIGKARALDDIACHSMSET